MLVCGHRVAWRARWLLAFLLLMCPLPGQIHNRIAGPLQDISTAGTMLALDVLGVVASRRGNVIFLNDDFPIGVAEARIVWVVGTLRLSVDAGSQVPLSATLLPTVDRMITPGPMIAVAPMFVVRGRHAPPAIVDLTVMF